VVAASRLDGKSAYVACSRGKVSCSLHTPDKAALLDSLGAGDRRIALDFLPEASGRDAGLNRLEAFQSVAQTKVAELGERVSRGMAGLRVRGWQQAVEMFKQLLPPDFEEKRTRDQDRT
jgi:hypothetical protein